MAKEIEFKNLYFRSFNQIEDFYNKMKIGTIVKWKSIINTKIGIYMGGNIQFAVLDINHKTVKECVDNLLLNPDTDVKVVNNATVILLRTSACISDYRQEELLLWCMKKKLLMDNTK